jgi:hypothetical protein
VLDPIGDNAQRKRLYGSQCPLAACAIRHHAGQIRDFGDLSAVILPLEFDSHDHQTNMLSTEKGHRRVSRK